MTSKQKWLWCRRRETVISVLRLSVRTLSTHPRFASFIKCLINTRKAMKGYILTTEGRLIKILAACNATANRENYICGTSDVTWCTCPADRVCVCVTGEVYMVTGVRGLLTVKHNQSWLLSEPCCPAAPVISLCTSIKISAEGWGMDSGPF